MKAIASYGASPSPGTVLALVGDEMKADSALAKACKQVGSVLLYDAPHDRDLPGWVAAQFQARKTPVEPDACRALVDIVGDGLQELASEIDKIAQWADGEQVTVRDVRQLASAVAETAGFELTDAWGRRDVAGVLAAAEEILERTPKQKRDEVARLSAMLAAHVDRIRTCHALDAEGVGAKEAASRLKRHPFYVQKLYAQARNFTEEELREATLLLARLDLALKGGSRLSAELELERTLIEVNRTGGAAGREARLDLRLRAAAGLRGLGRRGRGAGQTGSLRLLAGGGVPVDRAAGSRPVDHADELAVLGLDVRALIHGRAQAPRQRLDRRPVAQVLEPLAGGDTDALLLLLDVRHGVKMPAARAVEMVAERLRLRRGRRAESGPPAARGRRRPPSQPVAATASTSSSEEIPPAATTAGPRATTCRSSSRSGPSSVPSRSIAVQCSLRTPAAAQRSTASSTVEPGLVLPAAHGDPAAAGVDRDDERLADRVRESRGASSSANAAVPTTTRAAPASSSALASSTERMPPDACTAAGAAAAASRPSSVGRSRPERAPSRSTTCTIRAPAAAKRATSASGSRSRSVTRPKSPRSSRTASSPRRSTAGMISKPVSMLMC